MTKHSADIAAMQACGQAVIDLIDERMEAADIHNINQVLNILCSVTAYYIGGIDDQGLHRFAAISTFTEQLDAHLDDLPDHARALVKPETPQ